MGNKKIHINEYQERVLVKEAMMDGFSLDTLKSLPSFNAKVKYCRQYLGNHVGKGSSRIVFQLDDQWVLKLAFNDKGKAQNEEEYLLARDCYVHITPQVDSDNCDVDDYEYIVSEYVLPAKSADFQHIFGINFKTFASMIRTAAKQKDYRGFYSPCLPSDVFDKLVENNDDLSEFCEYIYNYDACVGDMTNLRQYGMVLRNNEPTIVLLDSGLTNNVWDRYYKR